MQDTANSIMSALYGVPGPGCRLGLPHKIVEAGGKALQEEGMTGEPLAVFG